ncbi:acyltransferase [Saccharicrinis fermentans]|uniref:Inner membrane protein YiaH n=1 Tax=Saccharicrinis fermentans DSM 9555 = JCM 21142 TaxID=869213 RepID=W7Y9C3_9BACT|nr:acyltransferase family protein [Saccharicrinis fermentans]GAF04942.1 inner membrane protein YiaH [Saccharicrinis fermentans DSM 9555 = JCM 21142]
MHTTQNTQWLNNLRVFATIAVITLHTCDSVYLFNIYNLNKWWVANIIDSSVRSCVPLFFMLSGALLLNKNETLHIFLKKRFIRIILPFVFWSLIYIAYWQILKIINGEEFALKTFVLFAINKLKTGAAVHLWYIYTILGLYFTFPILSKWIKNCKEIEIRYFLIIWAIIIISNLPLISLIKPNINMMFFTGYIGFPVLGYYLDQHISLSQKHYPLLMYIIGTVITIVGTYIISKTHNSFQHAFYDYITPNVILSSIGIFLFAKYLKIDNLIVLKIINTISKNSYGMYLVHILILLLMSKIGINNSFTHPAVGIPLTTIICIITSYSAISFLKRIPWGKYISG